jgi:hypothetical protein
MYTIDSQSTLNCTLLSFSSFIRDVLYAKILLAILILGFLTRSRAELNTITSERPNEKLLEEMDEEKNALTDANEIMEEREKMRRLREVESKPNEINPYILTNDLFFIIVIIYYFYLTKSNRRFLDFYLPNKYKQVL